MKSPDKLSRAPRHGLSPIPPAANGHAGGNGKRPAGPRSASPRTIGPVPDLERHLPSDWWKSLFNSVYLKTDGDVVENSQNTRQEVDQLVRTTGLRPTDRILDLCCGQGRHSLELARRGFGQVTGVDRSRYLIRLAKKRARAAGLNVSFHEGDARKFRLPESHFDCVILMGNSFGYFDREADDLVVLEAVKRVLRSGGTLAMDLTDGEWLRKNFERRSWEWIDQNHFVCRERSLTEDGSRLVSREVVVHAERGVIVDQFYAERLYTRQKIKEVLALAGFTAVRDHPWVSTESDRNQDLGMMAQRIFLTAQCPHKVGHTQRKGPLFPQVSVLMGDPSMPDPVKRNGVFNPEDHDTIRRLKDALGELDEFQFRYLDDHAALIDELKQAPPQFVLNLCDEGYRNDAFLELHVPALLELFGVPYSGAGPSCLSLCYNKAHVRAIAQALDVPVPLETYFNPDDQSATLPSVFPAIVKPNFGDSSVGITQQAVVHTPEQLIAYLQKLRETFTGCPVLIQEFLSGPEYSVGVVGNPGLRYQVLPVLEVDYSRLPPELPRILSYESKWHPDSPYWTEIRHHEARITEETRRRLLDYTNILFERLGCRDYARFDFRADAHGTVKLLEVNPNSGWCWDGKLNYMAGFAGLRYADLLRMILEAAQERYAAAARPIPPGRAP